ncbi:MAG TPA: FecR domain-containing protein, partial [Kofleriaceae bacterium]|nr:FecR domain-containing protein [Kofleriaceae bacterium]
AAAPAVVHAAPRPLTALVTLIEGDVSRGDGDAIVAPDDVGGKVVAVGDTFATGDGRVALQLGAASTATLGPRSHLHVDRLDSSMIALAVDGRVDVELERRAPDQRFLIVSGDRTVEVRGTAFRVDHAGGSLSVACEHGRVAVTGGGATVEVGAGEGLTVGDGDELLADRVRGLDEAELAALAAARPSPLGLWTDAPTMLATTAPLSLVAPRGRSVKVDGEIVGSGPIWMRKPAGRHLIEAERARGGFGPGRWVVVDERPSAPVILAEATPAGRAAAAAPLASASAAVRARKAELERNLDHVRLASCVRTLAKQVALAGTHVDLQLEVDGGGAISFLNIVHSDLPDRPTECVRDAVNAAHFAAGARASWRERISF